MSDSLRPHEQHHARPPCPSPTPGVYSNSCPSSRWCHPAISSSFVPFSSCPQSLPVSGSFPMSQLFAWGGQSTGVSASASVLPMNTQDWSPLGWTGWISLQSKGLSRVFSNTAVQKHLNLYFLVNAFQGYTFTSKYNFNCIFQVFKNLSIFNWRIIALQYCVCLSHTSTWISHKYTYVPSLLNLSPPLSFNTLYFYGSILYILLLK